MVEPFLFDAICYNLTTAYSTLMDEGAFTLRHVGDLTRRISSLVLQAQRTIEPFVKAFGDAYRTSANEAKNALAARRVPSRSGPITISW